jgi:hypothetical protein
MFLSKYLTVTGEMLTVPFLEASLGREKGRASAWLVDVE